VGTSQNSSPKVFVIDAEAEYRTLLRHHVTTHWADAMVKEYDPVASGRLPEGFSGAGNDIILLGEPGGDADALDWLRRFRAKSGFPPVVFIGDGSEREIIEAMKIGATEYISKERLNHQRLVEVLETSLASTDRSPSASESGKFFVDAEKLEDAGLPSIKGYEFKRRLVVNELSAVYLVSEQASGRLVVLKILRQVPDCGGEAVFDRFLQEYELIAKLDHPNIVRIFDLGVADDHAFIAMEYCSSGSLKLRIVRGLDPETSFNLMRQIAGALGELHDAGIMHRDLKPTNVMFRDDDSLVLIDFGLAKEAELRAEITSTGEIFGTPYYMSPEQGHAGQVDERGDIYSLGIIFYEMLSGKKPFEGETAMSVIIQHRNAPVPRLPANLARFQPCVDKMMAKQPEQRFQSVAELLAWVPETRDADVA
jgi:FixJ family two-component response regulator